LAADEYDAARNPEGAIMNIAIVTGASSGLGGCFVRLIDAQERLDEIWVIARRAERLEALRAQVRTPLRAMPMDLTDESAVRELEGLLAESSPDVRLLINAAGFGKIGRWDDVSLADCEAMIDLNCRAAVAVTRVALPYMGAGARIMEICSTSAFQPFPYLGIYAASKAVLYRYTRALRVELKPRRVKVTAVCPYWIKDTEFIAVAKRTQDSSYIRSFPLASRGERVARRALADSRLGLAVSTPGPVCFLHRIVAKIVPSGLMMGAWELLRRL
jgi:short-subunit dehydrogenase